MKHRKQTQHIRRYRSGRWTYVNRGIRYKMPPHTQNFAVRVTHLDGDFGVSPYGLEKIIKYGLTNLLHHGGNIEVEVISK